MTNVSLAQSHVCLCDAQLQRFGCWGHWANSSGLTSNQTLTSALQLVLIHKVYNLTFSSKFSKRTKVKHTQKSFKHKNQEQEAEPRPEGNIPWVKPNIFSPVCNTLVVCTHKQNETVLMFKWSNQSFFYKNKEFLSNAMEVTSLLSPADSPLVHWILKQTGHRGGAGFPSTPPHPTAWAVQPLCDRGASCFVPV